MKPQILILFLTIFLALENIQFSEPFPLTKADSFNLKRLPRAAVSKELLLWPNGEIPYKIDPSYTLEEKCHLERAMYHIMWNSCIRFINKSENDTHFVNFVKDFACYTTGIGLDLTQAQLVSFGTGCFDIGTMVHELMHVVGFFDEHNRHDRDDFVQILLSNIVDSKEMRQNFKKNSQKEEITLTHYDFDSVMHYGRDSYSETGKNTIESKLPNINITGPMNKLGLSKLDVVGLNKLYKCTNPLKPSYEFLRQFVLHYNSCVGKIYYGVNRSTESTTELSKNRNKLQSNRQKKRSTLIEEKLVHGDILIRRKIKRTRKDKKIQFSAINPATTLLLFNQTTWTHEVIPYELDHSLEPHKCLIENAMLQIMLNSCVRFRKRNENDRFYLRIMQDYEKPTCYGTIGMDEEDLVSKVSLIDGCYDIGTVVHELMHVIGFYHEHNRHDRDEYLRIYKDNVLSFAKSNFIKNNPNREIIFTPWDYNSVMLYGARAFSKDDESITMEPTMPGVELKDVRAKPGLSKFDAIAINQLYKCPSNVDDSNFYSNQYVLKPILELVKSCSNESALNSYLYIFK